MHRFPFLPCSLEWMQPWWDPNEGGQKLRIYFDGSHVSTEQDKQSGAAVAAFVQVHGTWCFAGAISTRLPQQFTSYSAELAASIIASKFAFDLSKLIQVGSRMADVEITFCFDSLTAGHQTSGLWNAFSEPRCGRLLRSLQKCIQYRYGAVLHYEHIKAHCGEPGNELVDTLAHQAALGEPLHDLEGWLRHVTGAHFVQSAEWMWFLFRTDVSWEGTHLLLPAAPTSTPHDVQPDEPKPSRHDSTGNMLGDLDLTLATCNVLSLLPTKEKHTSSVGPARQESILRQMDESNVHIFALQETRLRKLSNGHDPRFWLYRSAATQQGHFGIMIGLARTRPIGTVGTGDDAQQVYFSQEHVAVVATAPRYLILRLKTPLFRAILIAAHAPHSGATETEIGLWWDQITNMLPDRFAMWPRILLIDANARVGNEPCSHIGPHQAEKSNGKEEGFVHFVRSQGMFLPATFGRCQVGPGSTWRHSNGSWCRNDFVGLPIDWHYESCQAWVSMDIDVGIVKEDHRAAVVRITRQVAIADRTHSRKSFKLSLEAIQHLPMPCLSPCDWSLDVHTHASKLQDDVIDWFWKMQTKKPRKPLKTTMSAESWDLVQQKREARNTLAQHGQLQKNTLLAAWFACWKIAASDSEAPELFCEFDRLLHYQDKLIAVAYHHFRVLGRQVVKALRYDDVAFYDELLKEGSAYLGPKEVKRLWSVVRKSLPKFQQRKMTTPPFQLEGLEDQWLPHFGQLEAGTVTTLSQLLRQCNQRQIRSLFDAPREIQLGDLPTVFALEDAFRRTPEGKATGLDPLPSALFHQGANALAGPYHDLLLKEYVWQTEPLQYKGGPVAIIPKCLAPTAAKQFRGILLLGNMAKRTHSVLRQQVMSYLSPARAPGQLGGFQGQQVMFGSQALRLFGNMADAKGVSSAILFLDLSNAFHHLIRELVTGISTPGHLDEVLEVLRQTGHPVRQIEAACQLPGLLAALGAPAPLVRLICDIHAETWCSLPNNSYLQTHRGTRPGSPLADIIFHILMAAIAKDIDEWILSHGVHLPVLPTLDDSFPSVLWADDVAIPLATEQPQDLVPLLLDLLREVWESLHSRGFLLNFALGKTNALVTFRGQGASKLRMQYQLIPTPGVECSFSDDTTAWLHFVPRYKHLGTLITSDHSLDAELSARIGMAASAFSHLARPLLTNRHFPARIRLKLFNSLISSKLFFGLGAWHTLSPKLLQRLTGFYAKLLKKVLRWSPERWQQSHAQVFVAAQVLDIRARLAVERLLYAQRVFAVGPFFLQNAIHLEAELVNDSWLAGLKADLQWMEEVDPQGFPVGWQTDLTLLIDSWQSTASNWRARVKAVARKHQLQEKMMVEVSQLHKDCFKVLRAAGASFSSDPFSSPCEEGDHACFCGAAFMTRRGLLAHQRRAHQIFSVEHKFLQGAICQHCGRYCWTTQRLQQHLAYIPKKLGYNPCYQALLSQGREVEYEAASMPKEVIGLARREALPTCGPQPEQVTTLMKQRQQWQAELSSCHDQLRITDEPVDAQQRGAHIGDALTNCTNSWFQQHYPQGADEDAQQQLIDEWIQILCIDFGENNVTWDNWLAFVFLAWGTHWLPDIISEFWDGVAEKVVDELYAQFATELPRYQVLARVAFLETSLRQCTEEEPKPHRQPRPLNRNVLHPKCNSKVQQSVRRLFGEQEQWLKQMRECCFDGYPTEARCPRYKTIDDLPTFLVVHLFSGRRRHGDFHSALHQLAEGAKWQVIVLSLDTAVSLEFGNLMQGTASWDTVTSLYLSGRVSATLCGPPCETFSEARFTEAPSGFARWPRPLRSASRLFGLELLSTRELRQCAVGSAFFMQCVWALCVHVAKGGMFIAEHPAMPLDPTRPSIWTSPMIQLLLQLPDLKLFHVAQFRWGAEAVKPTGLLVWSLPFFHRDLHSEVLRDVVKPTAAAIGKDDSGQFKTAKHKEYPMQFCRALAKTLAQQFSRLVNRRQLGPIVPHDPALDEWISSAATASNTIRSGANWLPDFQDL